MQVLAVKVLDIRISKKFLVEIKNVQFLQHRHLKTICLYQADPTFTYTVVTVMLMFKIFFGESRQTCQKLIHFLILR